MSDIEEGVLEPEPVEEKPKAETRKLETGRQAVASPPVYLGVTREEMTWAALAHASILITVILGLMTGGFMVILGPIIPAIIWYAYRGKSAYVVDQARQATIFQVAGIVAILALAILGAVVLTIGWVVSALLTVVLVGLLLMPVMLVVTLLWVVAIVGLPIAQMIYGCYAALETNNGRPFRYRWIADLIDRYLVQA